MSIISHTPGHWSCYNETREEIGFQKGLKPREKTIVLLERVDYSLGHHRAFLTLTNATHYQWTNSTSK